MRETARQVGRAGDDTDERYMRRALELARRGEGATRPNPPVGAVVALRGRAVGEGCHRRAGSPHAEVVALRKAGRRSKGATLYVTLEPCSTSGRTAACTGEVLGAGISRVVAGVPDPNPVHGGKGLRLLRRAGLSVTEGVLRDECSRLIEPFAKWVATGVPLLTLKMAVTLDGRIADLRGSSRWLTGPASRRRVQDLRREADAVVVGCGTVRSDDPSLLCRIRGRSGLRRVIVDSRGVTPLSAQVLNDGHADRTAIATTSQCPDRRQDAYRRKGAQVWALPANKGQVSLRRLLRRLGKAGLLHVICEGGGVLAAGLVRAGCVDRYVFFIAPRLLGRDAVASIAGPGWPLGAAPKLKFTACERVGADILVHAQPSELSCLQV